MNIFYLDHDVSTCAEYHCNKHVVKMIVEYAQLLSTAHRILDGNLVQIKNKKLNLLQDESVTCENGKLIISNARCYKATHANHPCAIWVRESSENYNWLFSLFQALLREYTKRYGRIHVTNRLTDFLKNAPKNISSTSKTPRPQTMPDEFKVESAMESYRNFYRGPKRIFAVWPKGKIPHWFNK